MVLRLFSLLNLQFAHGHLFCFALQEDCCNKADFWRRGRIFGWTIFQPCHVMPASAAHGKRTVGIATEQRRDRTEGVTVAPFRWCIEFDGSSETSKERRISEIRRETRENAQMDRSGFSQQFRAINRELQFLIFRYQNSYSKIRFLGTKL